MAYMNAEKKAKLAPAIKAVLKKHGLKGSISVRNHSALVVKVKAGKIDFFGNLVARAKERGFADNIAHAERIAEKRHMDVNHYWLDESYSGKALACLKELKAAMNEGNHDRSDLMTDYFDVGWYINIEIGRWDRPYELTT